MRWIILRSCLMAMLAFHQVSLGQVKDASSSVLTEQQSPESAITTKALPMIRKNETYLSPGVDPENRLGTPLLKHLAADQAQFWTTPAHMDRESLAMFAGFAGFTGVLIGADHWITQQVPDKPNQLRHSQDLSNYAAYSMVAGAGGAYLFGKIRKNDLMSETGLLSGEAAVNSTAVAYFLKALTQRPRPLEDGGRGTLFHGGSSFPSEHAAVAWSIASVVAHEYPGPLSKFLAYGLASTVTLTRVTGKQHFSSDVLVGSALGWYLGRQVFRAHHDPELGGAAWGDLQDDSAPEPPSPARAGSPFVPLDSWVYPALEKLVALGYIDSAFMGLKPWTRIECAQFTEQAGDILSRDESNSQAGAVALYHRLREEFAYEFGLLEGRHNAVAAVDSVYVRGVSISGPALTDGYHFGQTVSYDFGRPFREGTNSQFGGSFHAALGPAVVFVRAEFQHAPSAPSLSDTVRQTTAGPNAA